MAIIPRDLAKSGYNPDTNVQIVNEPSNWWLYTHWQINIEIWQINLKFPWLLAIKVLQNHIIFEFFISPVKKKGCPGFSVCPLSLSLSLSLSLCSLFGCDVAAAVALVFLLLFSSNSVTSLLLQFAVRSLNWFYLLSCCKIGIGNFWNRCCFCICQQFSQRKTVWATFVFLVSSS